MEDITETGVQGPCITLVVESATEMGFQGPWMCIAPARDRPDDKAIRSVKDSISKEQTLKLPNRNCSHLRDSPRCLTLTN